MPPGQCLPISLWYAYIHISDYNDACYSYLLIIFTKIWNVLPITYALNVPIMLVLCFNMNKLKIAKKILCDMLAKFIQYRYSECSIEPYRWKLWWGEPFKPEPNMFKISLIIPSSTSQKIAYYSYFVIKSLPITPILFFCVNVSGNYVLTSRESVLL